MSVDTTLINYDLLFPEKLILKIFISGKVHWFLFIALLVILLLNLLIAMMGDTYAKVTFILINIDLRESFTP